MEYWLFDETGEHYGTRLAGFRLGEDGRYHALVMDVDTADMVQGHSAALELNIRWEGGELAFCDPATGRRIATLEDERARADTAEAELAVERARVRDLERQLRRQNP